MTPDAQSSITGISLTTAPIGLSMRHYESIKTIELIYNYTEISGPIELSINLEPEAALIINGKTIEDPSMVSHTLGLNENTPELTTEWIVTSPGKKESTYTIKETSTPTEYTQVEIISPANLNAKIDKNTLTINYDYQISTTTAEIRLKSETTPPLFSEIITITLDRTDLNPELNFNLPVSTSGGTYTEDYSLNITYIPEYFAFSTGQVANYTQEDSHTLVGYLTLYAADTGTGYILVKKTTAPAPEDFTALKTTTPSHQTYSLKKGEAQWTALVNLIPETEYTIYIGVEYNTKTHMDNLNASTTADPTPDDGWGMTAWGPELLIRSIKFYQGQTLLLPALLHNPTAVGALLEWTREEPLFLHLSSNYAVIPFTEVDAEQVVILGEDTAQFDYENQYHLQFVPTMGGVMLSTFLLATPQYMEYRLELVEN